MLGADAFEKKFHLLALEIGVDLSQPQSGLGHILLAIRSADDEHKIRTAQSTVAKYRAETRYVSSVTGRCSISFRRCAGVVPLVAHNRSGR